MKRRKEKGRKLSNKEENEISKLRLELSERSYHEVLPKKDEHDKSVTSFKNSDVLRLFIIIEYLLLSRIHRRAFL